jgi:hypothetical protein
MCGACFSPNEGTARPAERRRRRRGSFGDVNVTTRPMRTVCVNAPTPLVTSDAQPGPKEYTDTASDPGISCEVGDSPAGCYISLVV